MKAVLMSVKPDWLCFIFNGKKSLEIRRNRPAIKPPFKVYLYCTKAKTKNDIAQLHTDGEVQEVNGMVAAEFICDNILRFGVPYPAYQCELDPDILKKSCLTYYQLHRYAYHDDLYGWHISSLTIYDKPKEISEFVKPCPFGEDANCWQCNKSGYAPDMNLQCYNTMTRPPQSWCYVEEMK